MRAQIKNYIKTKKFALEVVALIFSGALLATTYSIFDGPVWQVVLYGLLECALGIPFFALCHFTNSHRRLGSVICIAVYVFLLFWLMSSSVAGYMETGEGFMQWLAQDEEEVGSAVIYMTLLSVGGAAFFATVVYYFSLIQFRIGMLTLIGLLPCVLYAKAIANVNNWYLVVLAGLVVFICIFRHRFDLETKTKGESGHDAENNPDAKNERVSLADFRFEKGLPALIIFAAIVLALGAAVPKQSEAMYYSVFEDIFLGGDVESDITEVSSELTQMSGNADGFRSVSNRRIYRVWGENVSYLKRQHFDVYDFESDRWTALENYSAADLTEDQWKENAEGLDLSMLHLAIKDAERLSPGFAGKYNLQNLAGQETIETGSAAVSIRSLNFAASYYVVPTGTYVVHPEDGTNSLVTRAGTFVRAEGQHDENFQYITRSSVNLKDMVSWCNMGGADMSSSDAENMLGELEDILRQAYEENKPEINAVRAFKHELDEALEYRDATAENTADISEEVRNLAHELTDGCEYDWQKAAALAQYFHTGDFVYDMDYYAPDNSVEYFLFESKRGTCSDYATAYVLLARAAGLSVRYTEGYAPESSGRRGLYYVKESDSHAFPEVYIPDTGWVIFEPTSGIVDNSGDSFFSRLTANIDIDYGLLAAIGIVTGALLTLVLVIRLIIPAVMEILFRAGIGLGYKSATDAYLRFLSKAEGRKLKKKFRENSINRGYENGKFSGGKDLHAMTPSQVRDEAMRLGVNNLVLTGLVEEYAYKGKKLPPAGAQRREWLRRDASAVGRDYRRLCGLLSFKT